MTFTRAAIITETRAWIGTPYRHQASLKGIGCDCLGLVRGVWRELLGPEPELPPAYSADWAEASGQETLAEAAARHLVPAKHAAILVTPGRMVHAHDGAAVAEVYFAPWWRRRLAFAFAFQGAAG